MIYKIIQFIRKLFNLIFYKHNKTISYKELEKKLENLLAFSSPIITINKSEKVYTIIFDYSSYHVRYILIIDVYLDTFYYQINNTLKNIAYDSNSCLYCISSNKKDKQSLLNYINRLRISILIT